MAIVLCAMLLASSVLLEAGSLTGQVTDEDGLAIPGAVVDVYTAKPRVGIPVTCPSCYRDCAKSTRTDDQGNFTLEQLDPSLLFRLLVMAPGRRAKLTELVDPLNTKLEVKLTKTPKDLATDQILNGRVLDEKGKPIAGAVVTPEGEKVNESMQRWGALEGVEKAAVTDSEGLFVLTCQKPKLALYLEVKAPNFAVFASKLFDLDGRIHEIRLQPGAHASGQLSYDDKPVKNRAIGIVQLERQAGKFVGESVIATDPDGNFLFSDLQLNQDYALYTLCDTSQELPVLKTMKFKTGGTGDNNRLGNLKLVPGLTFTGRVEFPKDAKLPNKQVEGAKIRISRDPAWDWAEAIINQDGEFVFRSLPPESYSARITAPGYEIDTKQIRYQTLGPTEFGIRLSTKSPSNERVVIPMRSTNPSGSAEAVR